jgi:hypothetical protein
MYRPSKRSALPSQTLQVAPNLMTLSLYDIGHHTPAGRPSNLHDRGGGSLMPFAAPSDGALESILHNVCCPDAEVQFLSGGLFAFCFEWFLEDKLKKQTPLNKLKCD